MTSAIKKGRLDYQEGKSESSVFLKTGETVSIQNFYALQQAAGFSLEEIDAELARVFGKIAFPAEGAAETSVELSKNHFKFLSIAEVLATPSTPEWLITGRLERKTLAMLFGVSGTMKSFFGIDKGLCIATARAWHGHEIQNAGPVFYFCGEGFSGIARRIKAWVISHNIDLSKIPFFVSNQAVQMLDPASVEAVSDAVQNLESLHGKPVLLIIDTLNRNFGPGDENSTADMTTFIAALDRLRAQFNCAILLIHHSGHLSTERARGASSLRACLDWEYRLDAAPDGLRTLTCTKSKDFEPPPPIGFRPEVIHFDDEENTSSITLHKVDVLSVSMQRPLTGATKIALDTLLTVAKETGNAHLDVWREAAYRGNISTSDDPSARRKAFTRAVAALRDSGRVIVDSDHACLAGQRDKSGTWAGHVPTVGGRDTGHISLDMSCPVPVKEDNTL